MKDIKYTKICYTVFVRNFVIPFYYGSVFEPVINYGSGSATVKSKGSYGSSSNSATGIFRSTQKSQIKRV
jgi:hypothetical protein